MTACPRCGTENAPHLPACALCGLLLARGVPKGTLLGLSPFPASPTTPLGPNDHEPIPETQPPPANAPQAGPEAQAGAVPAGVSRATLLGVAPELPPSPSPDALPARGHARTIIGMSPLSPSAKAPAVAGNDQNGSGNEQAAAPASPQLNRTILGVARPGIAPLEPGVQKIAPFAEPPVLEPQGEASAEELPYPGSQPTLTSGAARPAPRGIPVLAAIAVTIAAGLFAAGVVVLLLHRGTGPIEGRLVLGSDGKERLELRCGECPDGTRVAIGSARTSFTAHRGLLDLPQKLKIGDNRLSLLLTRPGEKKSTEVSLPVPIQYRVRADTSLLADANPRLRVVVEALPNSKVTIDSKALALDAAGRGIYDIDVAKDLRGAEPAIRKLERSVPYSVDPPDGAVESGKVTFQLGITPLVVEAPGERITIDTPTFVLSGRSQRGAAVQVAERPINIDAQGRFAQVMSVSSEGETTVVVRATAPDQAPRLYPIRVKRVGRLADEAARLRSKAVTSYAALGSGEGHVGEEVALDGTLLEHRAEGYASYLLLDVTSGCKAPPCLLRVIHGAPVRLARGAAVSVFGRVSGSVEGARAGTRVPEVFAAFLLPGAN